MHTEKAKRLRKAIWITLGVATAAALAWFSVKSGLLEHAGSTEELRAWIAGFGAWGGAVFFVLQLLTVIIAPIPSNVTTLAGSLALGFGWGFVLSAAAVYVGSVIMFLLARRLGARFAARFVSHGMMARYMPIIEEKRDVFLFATMLLPFFPDDALCIIAGLTGMPTLRFCVITLLTRPWGLLFAALVGGGVIQMPMWGWAIVVAAVAVLLPISMKHGPRLEERLLEWFRSRRGQ